MPALPPVPGGDHGAAPTDRSDGLSLELDEGADDVDEDRRNPSPADVPSSPATKDVDQSPPIPVAEVFSPVRGGGDDDTLHRTRSSPPFTSPRLLRRDIDMDLSSASDEHTVGRRLEFPDTDDNGTAADDAADPWTLIPEDLPPTRFRSQSLPGAAPAPTSDSTQRQCEEARVRLAIAQVMDAYTPRENAAARPDAIDQVVQALHRSHRHTSFALPATAQPATVQRAPPPHTLTMEPAEAPNEVDPDGAIQGAVMNAGLESVQSVQQHENVAAEASPVQGSTCLHFLAAAAGTLSAHQCIIYFMLVFITSMTAAVGFLPTSAGLVCAGLVWFCLETTSQRDEHWLWSFCCVVVFTWQFLFTTKCHLFRGLVKKKFAAWGSTDDKRKFDLWWERHQAPVRIRMKSAVMLIGGLATSNSVAYFLDKALAQCDPDSVDLQGGLVDYILIEANRAFVRSISTFVLVVFGAFGKDFLWFITANPRDADGDVFTKRVNVSLNAITRDENSGPPRFHLRTIKELSIENFLPVSNPEVLERAMNHAVDEQKKGTVPDEPGSPAMKGRFLQVERSVAAQINDQIVNQLSSLFGSTFMQWDIAGASAIQQQEYVYAMTYEDDTNTNKKFRLLLIRKDVFASMTNSDGAATPGMSPIRNLKWEGCQDKRCCMQGECKCYGSSRMKDLQTLRIMLEEQKMWSNEHNTMQKFNLEAWSRRDEQNGGPAARTKQLLEKWKSERILIAGTIMVAVPEATNQEALVSAMSRPH